MQQSDWMVLVSVWAVFYVFTYNYLYKHFWPAIKMENQNGSSAFPDFIYINNTTS